ncbi:hypothetical protein B0A58_16100 [Flavobacterium branchiophilum NBRC 15030 = ATCC 35035]|uniref:Lipoprotein n=1 Tax=Flavobacterium branchiophilum TaxID=55197 RepID=A0A543G186_9FLAO|nr:hypothetical protein [Flavobacterium branchiophilum]OXA65466.1 hypothetical protein B0A58_16100 [Flavobacterium branchiophilum NBRC 15030 = ATCC 35035]TQM39832.1 hypothetical protein BC670_0665 [Flavobacterium branchiophilum]GEM56743.1 hypothetical protein FB1_29640 [Flavobacterium branchiophilum NBRC 15030 = ATCC 35035]
MEALKNKQNVIYSLLYLSLIFTFSCKEVKGTNEVSTKTNILIDDPKINTTLISIMNFSIEVLNIAILTNLVFLTRLNQLFFIVR